MMDHFCRNISVRIILVGKIKIFMSMSRKNRKNKIFDRLFCRWRRSGAFGMVEKRNTNGRKRDCFFPTSTPMGTARYTSEAGRRHMQG
jgi:hypothetical protein